MRIYCELYSYTSKLVIQILVDIIISSECYLDFLNIGYPQKSHWFVVFLHQLGFSYLGLAITHSWTTPCIIRFIVILIYFTKPQMCPKMLAPMCPRKLGKKNNQLIFLARWLLTVWLKQLKDLPRNLPTPKPEFQPSAPLTIQYAQSSTAP